MMGISDLSIMKKDIHWVQAYSYLRDRYFWLTRDNEKSYYQPRSFSIIQLATTEGRFVFPFIVDKILNGVWIIDPQDDAKVFGTVRSIPDRAHPMIVLIDDATDLCVLEFGIRSRVDDDPNMLTTTHVHMRWEPENGFHTDFLTPVDEDVQPEVIPGKSRRFGPGFTPKHVRSGNRGSRKNRVSRYR